MVDSFLTPVMRRKCSFFNGLFYLILRILSYGAFSLTWLANRLCKFIGIKQSFYPFTGAPTWPPFWHINLADETSYENPLYPKMANPLSIL